MSAILTRIFGFQNAELVDDIIQETFLSALKTWSIKGRPENPEAWLMMVAKNKIINELNRRKRYAESNEKIHYEQAEDSIDELFLDNEIKDSQLRLLFACCHPDLNPKSQIMLTLKVLSGFGDKEIANALLMNPSAIKKGIFRARNQLKEKHTKIGIPFLSEISNRLDTVLTIIYLIFNEGYKTTRSKIIIDEELCYEAIRLALLLLEIREADKGKIHALLSLMYLTLARFPSRVNEIGELIEIGEQDRSKWDKELIGVGFHFLRKSRETRELSRFHLESTIASVHCSAKNYEDTDWETILYCYERLMELDDSMMVRLNHAIALSRVKGFEQGLGLLKSLEQNSGKTKRPLLFAAIADMNMHLERYEIAKSYYQVAFDLTEKKPDQKFIENKIMICDKRNIHRN